MIPPVHEQLELFQIIDAPYYIVAETYIVKVNIHLRYSRQHSVKCSHFVLLSESDKKRQRCPVTDAFALISSYYNIVLFTTPTLFAQFKVVPSRNHSGILIDVQIHRHDHCPFVIRYGAVLIDVTRGCGQIHLSVPEFKSDDIRPDYFFKLIMSRERLYPFSVPSVQHRRKYLIHQKFLES